MMTWTKLIAGCGGAVGLLVLCGAAASAQTVPAKPAQTRPQRPSQSARSAKTPTSQTAKVVERPRSGCHLFSASAYSGYVNMAGPDAASNTFLGAAPWGSDAQAGGALSVGCEKYGDSGSLSLIYEPSYDALVRNSEWNAFNHSANLRASRRLGYKWAADLSATGAIRNLNNFLFAPTSLSNAVAAPGSATDLIDAVLTGRYSNQQLAAALGGVPGLESPLTTVLYGFRTLSSSAAGSVTYRRSQRLSMRFGFAGARTQPFNTGEPAGANAGAFVQRVTSGTATGSVSYAMDPRTELSVEASAGRTVSDIYDSYVTRAMASLGRKIGVHWFLEGGAGVVYVTPVGGSFPLTEGAQAAFHGSAGYRLRNQSFMATVDREPTITYRTGSGSTLAVGGAWQWHPVGSNWQLSATGREQRFEQSSTQSLNGWLATGALSRMLTRRTSIQISYSYMNNTGTYVASMRDLKMHAIQFAAVWTNDAAQ